MTDIKWIQPPTPRKDVDLSWLSKEGSPVRAMFEPPAPPPPPENVAPPRAPSVPPPPPGPSPEELRVLAQCQEVLAVAAEAIAQLQEATRIEAGRTAELVTEMGLTVAEELAAGAIDADENRVVALIIEALELLNSERETRVFLNPSLYERLMESGHLEALRKEQNLTIRSEARIADRGCMVESSVGQVDARVKSRLRQLRHMLSERQGTRDPS